MSIPTSIDELANILLDETAYPATNGPKKPGDPAWCFFDDEREMDPDLSWGRQMALDFEEWNAAQSPWDEDATDPRHDEFAERLETVRSGNWLINFYKNQPRNNDNWRKLIMPLMKHLDDPKIGNDCATIVRTVRDSLPFAPGPIGGTTFVNPDGSRYNSMGTAWGSAKASFMKRHKLTDEHVSVERVQYEGQRQSKLVVGIRKTSDSVPSNYFDPNPRWSEKKDKSGEWVKAYDPGPYPLYRISPSMVMPFNSHRLTVREFEQAIIAGAETFDSVEESFVNAMEQDQIPDTRIMLLNMGYGSDGRHESALSHEESYLFGVLRMFEQDLACELMLVQDQSENLLASHFTKFGDYTETLLSILKFVSKDDENRADGENMMEFVTYALTGQTLTETK